MLNLVIFGREGVPGIAKKVNTHEKIVMEIRGMVKLLKYLLPLLGLSALEGIVTFISKLF